MSQRAFTAWLTVLEWVLGVLIFIVIYIVFWGFTGQMAHENACEERGGVWEASQICTDGDKILFRIGDDLTN